MARILNGRFPGLFYSYIVNNKDNYYKDIKNTITKLDTFYPMLLKQIPLTISKHVIFDVLLQYYQLFWEKYLVNHNNISKILAKLSTALSTSILSVIISQPGDLIYTQYIVFNINSTTNHGNSLKQLIQNNYYQNGMKRFYKGLSARLLHNSVVTSVQLLLNNYLNSIL